jgi:hypothetical protein
VNAQCFISCIAICEALAFFYFPTLRALCLLTRGLFPSERDHIAKFRLELTQQRGPPELLARDQSRAGPAERVKDQVAFFRGIAKHLAFIPHDSRKSKPGGPLVSAFEEGKMAAEKQTSVFFIGNSDTRHGAHRLRRSTIAGDRSTSRWRCRHEYLHSCSPSLQIRWAECVYFVDCMNSLTCASVRWRAKSWPSEPKDAAPFRPWVRRKMI